MPVNMNADEDICLLKETVRRFVRERLVPLESEVDESGIIPTEAREEMRALGLFGLSIPERYGGLGLTLSQEVELVFELGYTSPAFRSVIGTNVGIGSQGIVIDGTEMQKEAYLPRLASGELVASFALTEPDAGSDAASIRTMARLDGDHYVLTGTKRFITNAPIAGLFTVMARTGSIGDGADGISAFVVERQLPGLSVGPPYRKMGQRGADVCDVIFAECRAPRSALLGGREGQGFRTAMKVLDRGRLHVSAVCVGLAERMIEEALIYAKNRQQFGRPIAEFQLIQAMLAESRTECYAARTMIMDAARLFDQGKRVSMEASCAKLFASEMVGRVADRTVQIFGGAGYISDYPAERFYRDVRLFRIYEGTSEIQKISIARHMVENYS